MGRRRGDIASPYRTLGRKRSLIALLAGFGVVRGWLGAKVTSDHVIGRCVENEVCFPCRGAFRCARAEDGVPSARKGQDRSGGRGTASKLPQ
jgi:hypothetical protein